MISLWLGERYGFAYQPNEHVTESGCYEPLGSNQARQQAFSRWLEYYMPDVILFNDIRSHHPLYVRMRKVIEELGDTLPITVAEAKRSSGDRFATQRHMVSRARRKWREQEVEHFEHAAALWQIPASHASLQGTLDPQ